MRFKAEINFDGREITRRHLSRKDLPNLVKVCIDQRAYQFLRLSLSPFYAVVFLKNYSRVVELIPV